jgi:hypothetical protein
VWLVENYQRLQQYRQDRRRATKSIPGLQDTDCFHDGENVLEIVHQWHRSLKGCLRRDDLLTGEVLRMIDLMLHEETSRIPTKTVWAMSKRILEAAKKELRERGLGNDHNTPTMMRPPPSISSQSMSLAPSRRGEYSSQFDNVARAVSPLLYAPEVHDPVETEGRLVEMGLHRNRSTPYRFPQPSQQIPTRFNTVHESTNNSNFNITTGPRIQTHDPSTQTLHQFTQSMGEVNMHEENEFTSIPQDWAQSRRHNVVSMPSIPTVPLGESFYPPLHRETSEPVRSNLRHVPDGSLHNLHPQSSFIYGRNNSGHVFQEPVVANQPHAWPQENPSLQQTNPPPMQYATYNAHDDQDIGHWNYPPNLQGRSGASSPPPPQQMSMHPYPNSFHQNSPRAVVENPPQCMYSKAISFPKWLSTIICYKKSDLMIHNSSFSPCFHQAMLIL